MTNERAQALAAARNALAFLAMNQTEPITVEKIGGDAHVTLDRVVLRYQDYDDWSEIDYREFDSDTWRSVGDVDEMTDELQDEIHDAMTTIDAYAYHYGVDELNEAAADVAVATRVTMHEAKRHFEAGGAVLVSEYGHEPTQTVTAITTTHDRTRTTWDALAADVKEWRNRYPNQRFYIVPRPGVVAVDDARPADPEVAE